MAITIDDQGLDSILNEVEQAVTPLIKKEARRLAKAAGEESPPPEESAEGEGSPEGSAPPAGPEGSAPPAGPPEGSAPPAGPEGSAPPEDDGFPQDPAQLEQMVAQLPREQQEALYLATKKVLSAGGGGAAGPGPGAGAGGPPPPGPTGSPAMKGEMRSSPGNGGKNIKKSEENEDMDTKKLAELEKLVKKQAETIDLLQKGQTLVTQGLTKMAGAPMRKSVIGMSQVSESAGEPVDASNLSKAEIKEKLSEQIKAGKLSKKDKSKILDFWEHGGADVGSIAHLLKD